jgi:hypothetical protein
MLTGALILGTRISQSSSMLWSVPSSIKGICGSQETSPCPRRKESSVSIASTVSTAQMLFRYVITALHIASKLRFLQSAFARYVLNNQLGAVALLNPAMEGRTETDNVFNDGKCYFSRHKIHLICL